MSEKFMEASKEGESLSEEEKLDLFREKISLENYSGFVLTPELIRQLDDIDFQKIPTFSKEYESNKGEIMLNIAESSVIRGNSHEFRKVWFLPARLDVILPADETIAIRLVPGAIVNELHVYEGRGAIDKWTTKFNKFENEWKTEDFNTTHICQEDLAKTGAGFKIEKIRRE